MWIMSAIVSVFFILSGWYNIRNAELIAQKNINHISSGEENYFEERRAWREWGQTPKTTPVAIMKIGKKHLLGGILGLLVISPLIYWLKVI